MSTDFFDRMRASAARETHEQSRQAVFEERVIKQILRAANVTAPLKTLLDDAYTETNARRLSFRWFQAAFPQFPLRMGAQKVPYVQDVMGSQLFGSGFAKTPYFTEFKKFVEREDIDLTVERAALVFVWPRAQGGALMALHNYPPDGNNAWDPNCRNERGTRILRRFGNPPILYVIESLNDLLVSIGADWCLG